MNCLGKFILVTAALSVGLDRPDAAGASPLTGISEVRSLTQEQAQKNPAVSLVGTITWLDAVGSGLIIADESSSVWVYGPIPQGAGVGIAVRVDGHATEGYFTPQVRADKTVPLGTAPLPAPQRAPGREQLQGKWDNRRLVVSGTILREATGSGLLGLRLLSDGVPIWLTGPAPAPDLPSGQLLAEATGLSDLSVQAREVVDCGLLIQSWDAVRIIATNAPIPPLTTVRSVIVDTNSAVLDRPVTLEGVVTWRDDNRLILEDSGQGILVYESKPTGLAVGHRARVAGTAMRRLRRLEFKGERMEDLGPVPLPPATVPSATLSLSDPELHGRRIRVSGRYIHKYSARLGDEYFLVRPGLNESFRFNWRIEPDKAPPEVALNSILEVEGINMPRNLRSGAPDEHVIFVTSTDRIRVLEGPPLPRRVTLALAGITLVTVLGLVGGGVWWSYLRKLQEARQRQLESENRLQRRFALIAETASEQILTLDLRGRITFINPVGQRFLAHSEGSLTGQVYARWIAPEHRGSWTAAMAAAALGESVRPLEIELERADGSRVEIEVVLRRLSGEELHCIGRDLTATRKAQHELARQELQLRTIVESMAEGIIVIDLRGTLVSVNPAAESILGIRRQDVVGRTMREDWDCRDADGIPIPPDRYPIFRTLRTGVSIDGFELTLPHPTGRACWLSINSRVLMRGPEGGVEQVVATFTDITARRDAEQQRQQLEEQLRRSESLRALGTMAGGVAHDFNNLLACMLGNADLSLAMLPPDHPVAENSREIVVAAKRGADLVRRILSFSRPNTAGRQPVLLSVVTEEAARVVTRTLPRGVTLDWKVDADEQPVMGDRTQLHQVIVNLCTNAAHAMEAAGGQVELTISPVTTPPEPGGAAAGSGPEPAMRVRVRDTGCGMDQETIARIFEPFFTTKAPGRGTGLGMSIVNSVVQAHDGRITIESAPGRGTTVDILLPALAARAVRELPPPEETPLGPVGGGQRILAVDDDSAVLRLTATVLGRVGFRVIAQTNPIDAWNRFRAEPDAFDMLLTDLSMPEQSGAELALAIRRVRPDLPVIIVTGYGPTAEQLLSKAEGKFPVLSKPFAVAELVKLVQAEFTRTATGPEI